MIKIAKKKKGKSFTLIQVKRIKKPKKKPTKNKLKISDVVKEAQAITNQRKLPPVDILFGHRRR